jgi:hypothetical protein
MILGAQDVVQQQVEGKNKNKWWAWADLGLLNLLSVKLIDAEQQESYRKKAHQAYEQFKNNGAGKKNFESTIGVIKQLKQRFAEADEATASLMQNEIDYLKMNTPEH